MANLGDATLPNVTEATLAGDIGRIRGTTREVSLPGVLAYCRLAAVDELSVLMSSVEGLKGEGLMGGYCRFLEKDRFRPTDCCGRGGRGFEPSKSGGDGHSVSSEVESTVDGTRPPSAAYASRTSADAGVIGALDPDDDPYQDGPGS